MTSGGGSSVGKPVNLSASINGSSVTVYPQRITPSQVSEVTVIPEIESTNSTLEIIIRGEREGCEEIVHAEIVVVGGEWGGNGENDLAQMAAQVRDKFIPWLAANHPEFGITSETEWTGAITRPYIIVVMYYLFFSEEWEMSVSWHVTIPPHNWARIYLRHRFTEPAPSYAFELSSWSEEEAQIYPVALKDAFAESVWR